MAVVTRNRLLTTTSSSDQADSGDNHACCSSSEDEYQSIDNDDDTDDEYVVDDSDDEDKENKCVNVVENDNDDHKFDDDYNRVIHYLQENKELQKLTVNVCKAYLRRHGLRLSGNKDECAKRIVEHWRIKDGEAESLYPKSSFSINCTGDVCKGDVVLFTQKVYDSYDKMTRNGKVLGNRLVAGQVIKESYGAAKQQHTFTVEVLWSKGVNKLPPLRPLLVKGRNLYRMKTYRQPWKDEAQRKVVLDEKHRRGAVARSKRDTRRVRPSDNGRKPQKVSTGFKHHQPGVSSMKEQADSSTGFNHHQPGVPAMKAQASSSTGFNHHQPGVPAMKAQANSPDGINHHQHGVFAMKEQAGAPATKPNSRPFPKHFPAHRVSSFSHQNYSDQRVFPHTQPAAQRVYPHQDHRTQQPVLQRVFPCKSHHFQQPLPQRVFPCKNHHIQQPVAQRVFAHKNHHIQQPVPQRVFPRQDYHIRKHLDQRVFPHQNHHIQQHVAQRVFPHKDDDIRQPLQVNNGQTRYGLWRCCDKGCYEYDCCTSKYSAIFMYDTSTNHHHVNWKHM